MKTAVLTLVAFFLSMPASADPDHADPHNVFGIWLSETGDGRVAISDCGDGTPCGNLVWVDPATTPTDKDAMNRDLLLRDRPLIGVPILWGFEHGRTRWRRGSIYNPEDGETFRSTIRKKIDGTLEVKGCLGPICRTSIWTLANENSE